MGHSLSILGVAAWWLLRRLPKVLVLLLCALCVAGCGLVVPASRPAQKVQVFNVCWRPPELGPGEHHFDFSTVSGVASPRSAEPDPGAAPAYTKYVFQFSPDGPVKNLQLLPLSRVDAWCPHIPLPSHLDVPAFEPDPAPCPVPVSLEERLSDARLLFGQASNPPIRSPFFCDQQPRVTYTAEELMSLRARNLAYQSAYDQAYKTGKALALAEAEMQAVINKSDSWLKRALTSDPGTIEQIQQRVTDALNSIEPLPEYDDPTLESLAWAGYQAGFENGKFEVEAKLFAIDAGVMLIEFALLEVAMGPLGGAKLLASAVSKGTKALTAAVKRLENIPIFIPGAVGGPGAIVRIGKITSSVSAKVHRARLKKALENSVFKFKRKAGESTHHIVPIESNVEGAADCRKLLDKLKLNIDEEYNGVFLPMYKNSPNPTGAIVHATLDNPAYYAKVAEALSRATSQADAIRKLRRIRETLLDGTFYHAVL